MGIRIDGNNDLINAADGTLTVEGLSVNVVGVSTASGGYKVGTAYTVFPNGNVATAGIVTAASGTFTNGIDASSSTVTANQVTLSDTIEHSGDSNTKIRFPSTDTISFETAGSEALRINSDGDINVSTAATIKSNGNATFAGIVTAGSLKVGDGGPGAGDDKIALGEGDDLKIYHDGNSVIYDNGVGNLKIYSNGGAIELLKDTGEEMIIANTDGAVELYHNDVKTFETAAGGANFTGIMTANVSGVYLGTHAVGLGTTTTTGRNAGVGTPIGSLVFNRTTSLVQVFKGNKWSDISDDRFSATGGTKTESGGKIYHSMTGSTPFVVASGEKNIELLVIGGGGSGGGAEGAITGTNGGGGGGGAGAVIYKSAFPVTSGTYTISIGAGGAAVSTRVQGNDGGDTTFGPLTAGGGGGGGVASESPDVGDNAAGNAGTGGASSGGAGGGPNNAIAPDPPQPWPGSGDSPDTGWGGQGGRSTALPNTGGAGGGGARYDGMPANTNNLPPQSGGPGGQGVTFSTSGSPVGYAGGGGGATGAQNADNGRGGTNNPSIGNYPYPSSSSFGAGSGAKIASGVITPATAVTANTGAGGGGGAEYPGGPSPNTCGGGSGASGIVILNYPDT